MNQSRRLVWLRCSERAFLTIGCLLLISYIAARLDQKVSSRIAIESLTQPATATQRDPLPSLGIVQKPDFALWSGKRVRDYEASLVTGVSVPIAVLRIPNIHVEAPVLEGTSEINLNRGVGLIEGTSRPGEEGNMGIAGHRDGFFRALKDARPGDVMEIVTSRRVDRYSIDDIVIVDPKDVSVLAPRPRPAVTLVTCYPFYYIGSAPKRYIVHASIQRIPRQATLAERGGIAPNDLRVRSTR